jgi:hypothetical protein|uniref:RecT protein n=1 Tax=Myoviridae sp. ctxlX31 TaxID=2827293 RepID=A0A8S5R448_9CAUD|nr:MAG TPA: RecT protein [Myoviridae sp. ctxlX31]
MDSTEIIVQEQKYELSSGTFATIENFKDIYDIGKMFASSTLVPQAYQGKAMDCTIAVDMANRMGVSPMFVMQNLYVVKGKPSWSGQACMSMIKATPIYKNVRPVYFGEPDTDSWGCYVRAEDKKTGEIINGAKVTIQMAKEEGWYSKKDKYGNETSKWQTMPELMLAYRAASFFAKVYIPNSLMGCAVEGEVEDISEPARVATDEPLMSIPEEVRQEAEEVFK